MSMQDVQILRAACCLAGIDGEISDKERSILQHLAFQAGVGAKSLEAMMDMALTDKNFYQQQLKYALTDPDRTIRTLFCVVAADGRFTSEERIMLHHFATKVGMSEETYDALIAEEKAKLSTR